MSEEIVIRSATDARKCIGQRVYWDDISARYHFIRWGTLEAVEGRNVVIDGDYKWRAHLKGLRNFERKERNEL